MKNKPSIMLSLNKKSASTRWLTIFLVYVSFAFNIVPGDMSSESRFDASSCLRNYRGVSPGGTAIGRPMTAQSNVLALVTGPE